MASCLSRNNTIEIKSRFIFVITIDSFSHLKNYSVFSSFLLCVRHTKFPLYAPKYPSFEISSNSTANLRPRFNRYGVKVNVVLDVRGYSGMALCFILRTSKCRGSTTALPKRQMRSNSECGL